MRGGSDDCPRQARSGRPRPLRRQSSAKASHLPGSGLRRLPGLVAPPGAAPHGKTPQAQALDESSVGQPGFMNHRRACCDRRSARPPHPPRRRSAHAEIPLALGGGVSRRRGRRRSLSLSRPEVEAPMMPRPPAGRRNEERSERGDRPGVEDAVGLQS